MRRLDLALGGVAVAVAGAVWAATSSYPVPKDITRGMGPAFMPRLLAVLIAVLGIMIIIRTIRSKGGVRATLLPNGMPLVVLALVAAYALTIVPAGFLVSTPAFLVVGSVLLGARLRTAVAFGVGMSALTYVLFRMMLTVPLPLGDLLGGL